MKTATASSHTALVTIIGDSYTGGSDVGGYGAAGWPAIVETELQGDHIFIDEQILAKGGSGYVERGPQGGTFNDQVAAIDPSASLVVFFGSRNDVGRLPDDVGSAAINAWRSVRDRASDATVLVVGPAWPGDQPPLNLLAIRDVLRADATNEGLQFIDPLSDRWLADPAVVGSDGIHPNDAGHTLIALKLAPLIGQASGLEISLHGPTA